MSSFSIRPRFKQLVELTPEAIEERIQEQAQRDCHNCEVKSFRDFISIRIAESDRHFWSPRLHLDLEAEDGEGTHVRGIYGPNANVWALFFYSYLCIGFLGFIAGTIALTQVSLGSYPWGFWILGPLLLVALILYLTAQFGQKLGAQQTFQLHQIYEEAIGKPIAIH